jgi:hypothetical protein
MTTTVIEMAKMNEEVLTPSMFLKLTPEQRPGRGLVNRCVNII